MVVYQYVWIQVMKNFCKRFGIATIVFNKITIQIKVLCITSKAIAFWSILIDPGKRISV